jgi:hypothetical protein
LIFTYQSHIGLSVIKCQANQLLNKFTRRRWNENKQSAIIFQSSSSEPVSLLYVCDWLGLFKFEAHQLGKDCKSSYFKRLVWVSHNLSDLPTPTFLPHKTHLINILSEASSTIKANCQRYPMTLGTQMGFWKDFQQRCRPICKHFSWDKTVRRTFNRSVLVVWMIGVTDIFFEIELHWREQNSTGSEQCVCLYGPCWPGLSRLLLLPPSCAQRRWSTNHRSWQPTLRTPGNHHWAHLLTIIKHTWTSSAHWLLSLLIALSSLSHQAVLVLVTFSTLLLFCCFVMFIIKLLFCTCFRTPCIYITSLPQWSWHVKWLL